MIFFDIDGTIIDHKKAERTAVIEFYNENDFKRKIDLEGFYELWTKVTTEYFNLYLIGKLTFEEQRIGRVTQIFAEFDIDIEASSARLKFDVFLSRYKESLELFEDVLDSLKSLGDYRLGIISNGDYEQQCFKLKKTGIIDKFETIVTAGDVGVAKPDRRIFDIACEKANVLPHESYYIGDDIKTDIIACEKVGMKGILIDRENIVKDEYRCLKVNLLNKIKDLL